MRPHAGLGFITLVLFAAWSGAGCMPPATTDPNEPAPGANEDMQEPGDDMPDDGMPADDGDMPMDDPGEPAPAVEFGYTDDVTEAYVPVAAGEVMPLYQGFQGGSHIFVTLRATGFEPDESGQVAMVLSQRVTVNDGARVLSDFPQEISFSEVADGVVELRSRFIFLDSVTSDIEGATALITFALVDAADPNRIARIEQTVVLRR